MAGMEPGSIGWFDLTVDDADGVRDFYSKVVGWKHDAVSMGEYSDYNMMRPGSDNPVAGICHRRGMNEQVPRGWMLYIVVEDLDKSLEEVKSGGGKLLGEPRGSAEHGRYCPVEDPAGNAVMLFQTGSKG